MSEQELQDRITDLERDLADAHKREAELEGRLNAALEHLEELNRATRDLYDSVQTRF